MSCWWEDSILTSIENYSNLFFEDNIKRKKMQSSIYCHAKLVMTYRIYIVLYWKCYFISAYQPSSTFPYMCCAVTISLSLSQFFFFGIVSVFHLSRALYCLFMQISSFFRHDCRLNIKMCKFLFALPLCFVYVSVDR